MDHNIVAISVNIVSKTLLDATPAKIKYAAAGLCSLISTITQYILAPIGGASALHSAIVSFVVVLFIIDLILGVWRTLTRKSSDACKECDMMIKCVRKDAMFGKLSSYLFSRSLVKIIVYAIILYIGLSLMHLGNGTVMSILSDLSGGAVIAIVYITEIISILENLTCITVLKGIHIPLLGKAIGYFKTKESRLLEKDKMNELEQD